MWKLADKHVWEALGIFAWNVVIAVILVSSRN